MKEKKSLAESGRIMAAEARKKREVAEAALVLQKKDLQRQRQ
jgi:hypothetical protein